MPAAVQRVGDASTPSTTASPEMTNCLCRFLSTPLHDPRIATGPVVTALRDQAHPVAGALQPQPVAVVLDLVKPVRVSGTVVARVGMQNRRCWACPVR